MPLHPGDYALNPALNSGKAFGCRLGHSGLTHQPAGDMGPALLPSRMALYALCSLKSKEIEYRMRLRRGVNLG